MGANKFWVSVVIGVLATLKTYYGIDFGFTEMQVQTAVYVFLSVMIWVVPNIPGLSLISLAKRLFMK